MNSTGSLGNAILTQVDTTARGPFPMHLPSLMALNLVSPSSTMRHFEIDNPSLFSISTPNSLLLVSSIYAGYFAGQSIRRRQYPNKFKGTFLGIIVTLLIVEFLFLRPISIPLEHGGFVVLCTLCALLFERRN